MGQELVQDGYYKFSIPSDGIKIGQAATGVKIVARAVVKAEKGNEGFLQVRLEYGLTGDLDKVARKHTKEGEQAVKKADAMMMPKGKKKKAAKKKMPKGFMKGKKAQMME